jgi:hypothetical protein
MALQARELCEYIAGPKAGRARERVEHRGSTNLLNLDFPGQVDEMADLIAISHWAAQPLQHWILSWPRGEQPTARQADEAVRIFLGEFGLAEHQCLYALHRDTANYHVHLAINRIHPETERIVAVNGGWDVEAAHRAIARIEHAHGWQRQQRGLYMVLENGELERAPVAELAEKQLSARARDIEHLTGRKSAERVARERATDLLRDARDWNELHALLSEQGMRLEPRGGGAILWVGEVPVKASSVARDVAFSALERRLGPYSPPNAPPRAVSLAPEPLEPAARERAEYAAEGRARVSFNKHERERRRKRQSEVWAATLVRQREDRRQFLGGSWLGRGLERAALRSVLAERHAHERADVRDRLRRERESLRTRGPRWPRFERWLCDRGRPQLAEAWRFRDKTSARVVGPTPELAPPRDFDLFRAHGRGREVGYSRHSQFGSSLSFSDRGREVLVHDCGPESVLGALRLAARKWRFFRVSGSSEYERLCHALAAEHGFRITKDERRVEVSSSAKRLPLSAVAREQARVVHSGPARRVPVRDIAEAYQRHHEEVRNDPVDRDADPSRQDALVALRLRATGYDRGQIQDVVRRQAPRLRAHEGRDWDEYARRAVEHAFGLSAARQLGELEPQRLRLLELEGRAPSRELQPRVARRLDLDRGR